MTNGSKSPSRNRRSITLAATAAFALAAPLTVGSPAVADANFPSPNGNTNTASIVDYADLIAELDKLESTSRFGFDAFTLAEAGTAVNTSETGRDLYVATVGTGPEAVWLQGRIHGNEPYGTESLLAVLKELAANGSPEWELLRESYTFHVIPMYNPDGSEMNIRHTVLQDGTDKRIDLNRDWGVGKFEAAESEAFYEYWTMVDPAFAVDIHHQGLKTERGDGDEVTLSLGVSLAPGGPTLPGIQGGAYDVLTRQMQVHVFDELSKYGYINIDRYDVGRGIEIDIKGGVVSAMMLGLDHDGLNPEGHSNPAIFFETSGNSSDSSLGQKARGKSIQQNVLALQELLVGMATGEVQQEDPARWDEIPHAPVVGYQTDTGVIPASF
jgi:hypothetical protein